MGLAAYVASARFGVLRARVVEAEHFQLTHSGSTIGQTLGLGRRVPAGELCVRRGRPELRLLDGHVALMDGNRRVRVQIDPAFRPAPPVSRPTPEAARGQQLMRAYAGRPVVLLSDANEAPEAVLDASRGVRPAPAKAAASPASSPPPEGGGEDGGVAGWAASLLAPPATPADSQAETRGGGFGLGAAVAGVEAGAAPSWQRPRAAGDDTPTRPPRVQAELEAARSDAAKHRS